MTLLDRYVDSESAIHALDPRVKLVATIGFIISIAVMPDGAWGVYLVALLLVLGVALAAHVSPWLVIRRSLVGLPFLLAAVTLLFTVPGNAIWHGPLGLTVTNAGLERFASIAARSFISIQAAVLLTATTPFTDLLTAMRRLHIPAVLVAIIAFMYRYISVLVDEVQRLLRARAARSASLPNRPGGSLAWRASVAGHMAGQLLIRSLDRSDRVYQAMLARGYHGEIRTLSPQRELGSLDIVALAVAVLAMTLLQVAAR